ncbi:MAG TPA: phosphate ABC transporter substrate-binding/OmpA family protein [Vicinamibacteria bacterium]|nr:phosphate ABC transporter substrate-binding/OmpA family protein [Vicinamibacteria bacterium]
MARQLTPLGRFLFVLAGLSLLGYGLYRYGVLDRVASVLAPEKREEGTVSREDFAGGAAGGTATAAGTSAGAPLSGGTRLKRPIKVAIVLWGGYAGGIMANGGMLPNPDSTFSREFDVQVELLQIDDFDKSRDAFRAGGDRGGVDIMWSTVDAYALEYGGLSKLDPKAIMQYDWSRGGDAIAVDASIKSVADLRGKRLASAEATPSHYFALYVLTQGGLTNRDVDWVFTSSAVDAANVFKAGKVDAAVSWSPDVYVAARERQGGHILASTREATNLIADIFVARGDFLEQHPEDARRFVAGWLRGVEMVNKNPEKAAVLLQKSLTGVNTLEDAKAMLEDVKLPDYAENRAFFNPQGSLVNYYSIYQSAQNIWRKIGKISSVSAPQQTLDTRFLEGAAQYFPESATSVAAARPEFEFKAPGARSSAAPILTKTVSIYFPSGSSVLDENAKAVLDTQVVDLAATFGSAYLRVSGNTDSVGARDANVRLSRARADAVARYLMTRGFDRNKFDVVGNGPDKPVAGNDTEAGRARNRRTDFDIVPR